jgi:O-antigen ligase
MLMLDTHLHISAQRGSVNAREQSSVYTRRLSLRALPPDAALLVGYIILSRGYIGDEANLGIKLGPVPIFATDALLITLIAISLRKHTNRLLNWGFGGSGAGPIGRAVWILCFLALIYFVFAFPQYQLYAARDLAIFGYSLFFPLTYFALTQRIFAVKLVRYFIYATCLGAALFNFQSLTGIFWLGGYQTSKGLLGHGSVQLMSAGNLGDNLSATLAGLFAYLALERQRRALHAGALLVCLAALVQLADRSTIVGFLLGMSVLFIVGGGRSRVYFVALATGMISLLLLSGQGELPIPGGARLHGLWLALSSGSNYQSDPDAQFRFQRWDEASQTWMTSPIFGIGFGAPIIVEDAWTKSEVKGAKERSKMGSFNQGLPHNTFLTVLARTGPLGLGLILFSWITGIIKILRIRRRRVMEPDELATLAALVAMIPIAALNLFFERPMLGSPFWIILAAGYKLSENVPAPATIARTGRISTPGDAAPSWLQPVDYLTSKRAAPVYVANRRMLWRSKRHFEGDSGRNKLS